MKKLFFLCLTLLSFAGMLAGCASRELSASSSSENTSEESGSPSESSLQAEAESEQPEGSYDGVPTVYMTTDISAEGLIAIYEALGAAPSGISAQAMRSRGRRGATCCW